MTSHPSLTTRDDRARLYIFFALLFAIIVAWLALAGPALAWQEDERDLSAMTSAAPKQQRAGFVRDRVLGGRPAGCPALWCGCFLSKYLGLNDRNLWLARNWTKDKRFKRVYQPAPGVIAVFARGRRGGHVGIIKQVTGPRTILMLSGND